MNDIPRKMKACCSLAAVITLLVGCQSKKEAVSAEEPAVLSLIRNAEIAEAAWKEARAEARHAKMIARARGEPSLGHTSLTASEMPKWEEEQDAMEAYFEAAKPLHFYKGKPYEQQQIIAYQERHSLRSSIDRLESNAEDNLSNPGDREELVSQRARLRELEAAWRLESEGEKWREHVPAAE